MRTRREHYYTFGPFRLEPDECRLLCDGLQIPLTPKAFAMLLLLVRNSGRLVDKEFLMNELWPDAFVEESNLTFSISVLRKALRQTAQTASYIETVPKRGYRFIAAVREVHTENDVKSLAVLPFVNLSSGEDGEYFADGLHDALISELARIASLRVISRTSSVQYKSATWTVPAFARALQLDVVVEGSVLLEDDRVRISVRLIDAPDDRYLWTQSYERHRRDVLSLQSEMARAIAAEIEVKVTTDEVDRLRNAQTIDPEAHAEYLRGRYHWHQFFTASGMTTAISHFRKAIQIEPGYSRAWAYLSGCFSAMAVQSMLPPAEAALEGKNAAKQALALAPLLPESHISMAATHLFFDWDWSAAESAIKSALDLSLNCEAHGLFTHYALARGWGQQAIAAQRRALDLDPMSATMNIDLIWAHLLNREYDKALEVSLGTQHMKFSYPLQHMYVGQLYLCTKKYEEAIAEMEKALPIEDEAPAPILAMLGCAYGLAGNSDAALSMLRRLQELSRRCYVSPYDRAVIYTGLGEAADALRCLVEALDDRTPRMIWLKVEPTFDSLRGDRRFEDIVLRLGLE